MSGNRKLQRNGSSINRVEETLRRLNVEDSGNGGAGNDPDTYPDRPGEPDCIYFLKTGSCGFGSNCRFNHPSQVHDVKNISELPERAGQPVCGYYLKTGTCKYGSACKYHHPKDKPTDVLMNALGLPIREDAKPCSYYMRTGSCNYGAACKFHHPPLASTGNALPVVAPGVSMAVPSSGTISVGEPSEPSLSKATYFAGSLQLPPTYMPLYVPPPQGWNTYMASVGPLPVTSVLTTSPATNGQMPTMYLPERPHQPECRYFMTYGSCKYGSECKYHHPREKVLALGSIGPLGLPLRPGQPVCSYYSFYGLCKYGPTCKFDHPLDGHSYAYNTPYGLNIPPLGLSYLTMSPYQGIFVPDSNVSKSRDWVKKGSTASNNDDTKNEYANTKDSPKGQDSLNTSSEVTKDSPKGQDSLKTSSEFVIQNGPE